MLQKKLLIVPVVAKCKAIRYFKINIQFTYLIMPVLNLFFEND